MDSSFGCRNAKNDTFPTQGRALRKISGSHSGFQGAQTSKLVAQIKILGSPLGSQPFQLGCPRLSSTRLSTFDEEVFCTRTNLTGLLFTKLGNFSLWVRQKPACCLMKPIKVFVPFRFKTRNMSNAAELHV